MAHHGCGLDGALARPRHGDSGRGRGYGVVCDVLGQPIDGLVVHSANQEHGIVTARGGGACDLARFPIGTPLRILPNHACATAAQFGEYQVLADGALQVERWVRFNHW